MVETAVMRPLVPFVRRVDEGPHPALLAALRRPLSEVELVERMGRVPTGAANRPLQDLTIEALRISRN